MKHIKHRRWLSSRHGIGGVRLPASKIPSHTLPTATIKFCYPARKSTHRLPKHTASVVFLWESYSFMKPRTDRMAVLRENKTKRKTDKHLFPLAWRHHCKHIVVEVLAQWKFFFVLYILNGIMNSFVLFWLLFFQLYYQKKIIPHVHGAHNILPSRERSYSSDPISKLTVHLIFFSTL